MQTFNHFMPVDIHFGNNILKDSERFNLPFHKAFILTGREAYKDAKKAFNTLLKQLEANNIKYVIEDTIEHPLTIQTIHQSALKAKKASCDFIIGFGSGKSLDASKLVAKLINEEDYTLLDAWMKSKTYPPFETEKAFLLTIPTSLNHASAFNPKAFIYDLQIQRQIRFKHESLFPSMTICDPLLIKTLPIKHRFSPLIDTFIRAIDVLEKDYSPLHNEHALRTLKTLIDTASGLNRENPEETTVYQIVFALSYLNQLYMPKPWFPLHQLSDAIEGYHETLPPSAFIKKAAPYYLSHRLTQYKNKTLNHLIESFKATPYQSKNLFVSIKYFFAALNDDDVSLKRAGLELELISDYMVHMKTIYPDFNKLSSEALYDILEQTLLQE